MASHSDPEGGPHLASAEPNDSFAARLSATLAYLVSQPSVGIDNAIHTAEGLLAEAPTDICIPVDCWENLGVLFEKKYQQSKNLDHLQAAITWVELGATVVPRGDLARIRCLSKVATYRKSRNDHRRNSEVTSESREQMDDIRWETSQDALTTHPKRALDGPDDIPRKRVKAGTETPSLDSSSASHAIHSRVDIDSLNHEIHVAEVVIADAPADFCIPADHFTNLGALLERRYQQKKELDDLQAAITWTEQGVAAISGSVGQVFCLSNLIGYLLSRYDRIRDLQDIFEACKLLSELGDLALPPIGILDDVNPDSIKGLRVAPGGAYKGPPPASLDIISTRISDLASRDPDDPNCLDIAIVLVGNYLAAIFRSCCDIDHTNISILVRIFGIQYNRITNFDDLQKIIIFLEIAVVATPVHDPDRASYVGILGDMLSMKFKQTKDMDDLQKAILRCEEGVAAESLGSFSWATGLNHLAELLRMRFDIVGDINDLHRSILKSEEMLAATPNNHADRPGSLNNQGRRLLARFQLTRDMEDLQRAISCSEEALAIISKDCIDRATYVNNLSEYLRTRFEETGDLNDLQQAVVLAEEAVAATPIDHPERATRLDNLCASLQFRSIRTGGIDDLQRAISQYKEAVDLTPINHPVRMRHLHNLSYMLGKRYNQIGDFDDLQWAIQLSEEVVSTTPTNDPESCNYSYNLSKLLQWRSSRTEDIDDLKRAIEQTKAAVAAAPSHSPGRAKCLIILSSMYLFRFHRTGVTVDLQQATLWTEQAGATNYFSRGLIMENLSIILRTKFDHTRNMADLQEAILRSEEALAATPINDTGRAQALHNHGRTLNTKYKYTKDPHDHKRAISYYQESLSLRSGILSERLDAAYEATFMLAEGENWADACEMAEIAVNLLIHLSSRSVSRNDQQHMLKKYTGIATRVASFALLAGKSATDALQLLELGRGVIASLQFETRTDLTELREQYPLKAKEFEQLRDELDSSKTMPLASTQLPSLVSSTRHALSLELDKTISRIRQLPNFQRFLLPPTASELMMAATPQQPVAVINCSDSTYCDAFLIEHDKIRVLNLPNLHFTDVQKAATRFKYHRLTKHEMLVLLQWLWDVLAGPVLDELGFREAVTIKEWPRICWIPTGILSILPVHAAGYHCEPGSRTVLDRAVSSYGLSLKALMYARQSRIRTEASAKALFVSMDKTPGCAGLTFARREIIELEGLLPTSIPRVTLHNTHKEDVLAELDGCTVFHFAGHGQSHPYDPSMSTLLTTDWQTNPLTVQDLINLKLHQNPPFLAYLSACSTGDIKDTALLDEGIHLMGACQLSGFRHVIGSLWEVSDKHCVDAAKDVYDTIVKAEMSDESVSQGLHNAVMNLRGGHGCTGTTRETRDARLIQTEENPEDRIGDPYIWAAYIHMGI